MSIPSSKDAVWIAATAVSVLLAAGCQPQPVQHNEAVRLERLAASLGGVAHLRNVGALEEALELSQELEDAFGADPLMYYQRAQVYELLADWRAAEDTLLLSVEMEPDAYVVLMQFYERRSETSKAEALANQAARDERFGKTSKALATVYAVLGRMLLAEGAYEKALVACREGLEVTPPDEEVLARYLEELRSKIAQAGKPVNRDE